MWGWLSHNLAWPSAEPRRCCPHRARRRDQCHCPAQQGQQSTVKGIISPQTPELQRNLQVQEQTLSSPRVSKNCDFIVRVLVLGFSLQIPTLQSDQKEEVADDRKDESGEGECVGE